MDIEFSKINSLLPVMPAVMLVQVVVPAGTGASELSEIAVLFDDIALHMSGGEL